MEEHIKMIREYTRNNPHVYKVCRYSQCELTQINTSRFCNYHEELRQLRYYSAPLQLDDSSDDDLRPEIKVKNLLIDNNIEFVYNKSISGTVKKYRPDFLIYCDTHYLIIEVDERQHKDECYNNDVERMIHITQALNTQVVFIRFNPHDYRCCNEPRWEYDGRENVLLQLICEIMNSISHNRLEIYYLFYDIDIDSEIRKKIIDFEFFN